MLIFETAPLSERREHFLPLGLWNYQGYSRPSGHFLCAPCVVRLEKSTWRSSRTRKKIKKFSFEELPSGFFRIHGKNFEKTYPLALVLRCWFFETAPLSERREHFLPLGLWNYQGYSRPSGKKFSSLQSCVSKKIHCVLRCWWDGASQAVELAKK